MDLLRGEFSEHVISRSGPVNWPLRSCDLTPLDYFMGGYVEADNIEAFIRKILAKMLERVCQNGTKRMDHLRLIGVNICMK